MHDTLPTIHIIYASASGNTEAVVEKVSELLFKHDISCEVTKAELTKAETIIKSHYLIFATSTWEHGVLNPYFNEVFKVIRENSMKGKIAAFIGLGDTRYEPVLFCEGIEVVKKAFTERGGIQIHTTLKINGDPYDKLDNLVADWANELVEELTKADV